jgi:predicted alpha/beta hydrolase
MDLSIEGEGGERIAARVFGTDAPVGAVLLVPAMGVTQRFYEPLARWLASQGFVAMTFDFRGVGASKDVPLAKLEVDILAWARVDAAAALDELSRRAPGLPVTWVGHSLGGQIVPFVPNRNRVTKIVTVATGSGYWRENAPALRRKVWVFWWGAVPALTPLFGYFPGKRLGMVGDLPRGVIRQWRRWCLHPEYAVGVEGAGVRDLFAGVQTPLTAFSFTDDEMMSAENVASIHSFYASAPRAMRRLSPTTLGVRRVGHFGFFRKEMEYPLWRAHLAPELARAPDTTRCT